MSMWSEGLCITLSVHRSEKCKKLITEEALVQLISIRAPRSILKKIEKKLIKSKSIVQIILTIFGKENQYSAAFDEMIVKNHLSFV